MLKKMDSLKSNNSMASNFSSGSQKFMSLKKRLHPLGMSGQVSKLIRNEALSKLRKKNKNEEA